MSHGPAVGRILHSLLSQLLGSYFMIAIVASAIAFFAGATIHTVVTWLIATLPIPTWIATIALLRFHLSVYPRSWVIRMVTFEAVAAAVAVTFIATVSAWELAVRTPLPDWASTALGLAILLLGIAPVITVYEIERHRSGRDPQRPPPFGADD